MEGIAEQQIRILARKQNLAGLIQNVGHEIENHVYIFLCQNLFHLALQHFLCHLAVFCADIAALTDAEADAAAGEYLIVLRQHLFCCALLQILARFKHFLCKLVNINACNFRQLARRILVLRRTGRRAENQRVRQNGTAQNARHIRLDFHAIFSIHLIDNGRCAANRMVAEIHRTARLQIANAMMVNNL